MTSLSTQKLKTIIGGAGTRYDPDVPSKAIIEPRDCFTEDTFILTQHGPKAIKDLMAEVDQVWNPLNKQWMQIERITTSILQDCLYTIITASGSVTVSANHPFMSLTQGLLQACELHLGDSLANGEDGDQILRITQVPNDDYVLVYNLVFGAESEDISANFVLANGVVAGVLVLEEQIQRKQLSMAID